MSSLVWLLRAGFALGRGDLAILLLLGRRGVERAAVGFGFAALGIVQVRCEVQG